MLKENSHSIISIDAGASEREFNIHSQLKMRKNRKTILYRARNKNLLA
jgi:hypothetical protein